tara:strand:+ start:409 stop:642 length:234 start_codon:yes stop_codon:yes gene_type:complete
VELLNPIEHAWILLKEESMEKQKQAIIDCLKREGGAASLDDCCKAAKMEKEECKKLIGTMGNIKTHKHGDIILMDGL